MALFPARRLPPFSPCRRVRGPADLPRFLPSSVARCQDARRIEVSRVTIVFLGSFRVTPRVPLAPTFGVQPRVADHLGAEGHDHRPRSFAIAAVGAARRITRFIVLDLMGNGGNKGNARRNRLMFLTFYRCSAWYPLGQRVGNVGNSVVRSGLRIPFGFGAGLGRCPCCPPVAPSGNVRGNIKTVCFTIA
jgi:hypothetical protein